ncbi:MAG: hypothetical protein F6J98_30895 [Moorea sp. SIO4G2]|nr:hypothetical protein [Moorena sp. SIO4G2]
MQRGLGKAARSWGFPRGLQGADAGSAHRPKTMSDCRGFPHERLHQDNDNGARSRTYAKLA